MSHPAKNRFPISTFSYLNTIWRTNSYKCIFYRIRLQAIGMMLFEKKYFFSQRQQSLQNYQWPLSIGPGAADNFHMEASPND